MIERELLNVSSWAYHVTNFCKNVTFDQLVQYYIKDCTLYNIIVKLKIKNS